MTSELDSMKQRLANAINYQQELDGKCTAAEEQISKYEEMVEVGTCLNWAEIGSQFWLISLFQSWLDKYCIILLSLPGKYLVWYVS